MSNPAPGSILVVDDDDEIRQALCETLTERGYTVYGARNGREALDLLKGEARPALILLDLVMPVMNGWEFRMEQGQDPVLAVIPVVLTSASQGADKQAETMKVETFIRKPIHLHRLLSVVRKYCGSPLSERNRPEE